MSAGHAGHIDPANKNVALLIAVLALVLAFSETLGKAAQTSALASHIEASNLWSFFQAKDHPPDDGAHRRRGDEAQFGAKAPEGVRKQIDAWKKTAERYQSEPETKRGPQGIDGACEGRRGEARPRDGGVSQLRGGLGRGCRSPSCSPPPRSSPGSRRSCGSRTAGRDRRRVQPDRLLWPTAVHLF